jgi:hypothetical protein
LEGKRGTMHDLNVLEENHREREAHGRTTRKFLFGVLAAVPHLGCLGLPWKLA